MEDLINYFILDFVWGFLNFFRYKVIEIKKISYLKCVFMFKDNEYKLSLIFFDELDEINVDMLLDYFSVENDFSGW